MSKSDCILMPNRRFRDEADGERKLNGENLPCFAHAPQRVPTHRQQLPSHPLRGLHERLGN
jgi:hypothetical protein